MKWRKTRRSKRATTEQPASPIADVGRGIYGPEDTKERPVSRFERSRMPGKRSNAQHHT